MVLESTQSSSRNEYQGYSLGAKGGRCVGLQPYHLHVQIVQKSLEPQLPGALTAYLGL
jgi:hypothetical protein